MVRALQPADPRLIGPYRLVGQLGSGGMGQVFLAMSAGGRPVAVKMIRAELAADPDFRSRFSREVTAARRVNGLFTALVVDADVDAQVPWLATAYVAGPSLAETVKEHGPLSARQVMALAAALAEGLNAIHAAGVVHGDLKPSNVLLAEDGPRVIDFGISHAAETAPLTHPGLVMGSPGFMSPEQAMGRKVGPLSDVFSLGAVLAFAATGERPFGTGTPIALLDRVIHGTPNLDKVPPEVRPLVQRCLAKDPSERPSAAGLLAELGALQAETGWEPESIMGVFPRDIPSDGEDDRKGGGGSTGTLTLGSAAQDPGALPRHARPGAPAKPDDQLQPADQPQRDDQVQAGDRAQLHQVETGDQARPHDLLELNGQPHTGEQMKPDQQLLPDDQPQSGESGRDEPRMPWWRQLAAACVIGGLLAASGAAGYALSTGIRHLSSASSPSGNQARGPTPTASAIASPPALPGAPSGPLQVTKVYTYRQGAMVFVDIYYTDPDHNANGFGFMGVAGSRIGDVHYSFSSPGAGIVETGSITYPFDEGCGTAQPRSDSIEVWITAPGKQSPTSQPVRLACAS
jgi:serine/threonine protein kinase